MMENNWYVYRHIRKDKNEPFYIGIGNKENYARAYQTNPNRRNEIWGKIFIKTDIEIEIILEGLSKTQASEKEKEFIKLYGRKNLNTGSLTNFGFDLISCNLAKLILMCSKTSLGNLFE